MLKLDKRDYTDVSARLVLLARSGALQTLGWVRLGKASKLQTPRPALSVLKHHRTHVAVMLQKTTILMVSIGSVIVLPLQ